MGVKVPTAILRLTMSANNAPKLEVAIKVWVVATMPDDEIAMAEERAAEAAAEAAAIAAAEDAAEAAAKAEARGVDVIQDRCPKVEIPRLMG